MSKAKAGAKKGADYEELLRLKDENKKLRGLLAAFIRDRHKSDSLTLIALDVDRT
jgi:hypothetical protein